MIYNTPELISVGSAQNTVLAGIDHKFESWSNVDDSPVPQYDDFSLLGDGSSW